MARRGPSPHLLNLRSVTPHLVSTDRHGPLLQVEALVVASQRGGELLHPNMRNFGVNIAYVIDPSLSHSDRLDMANVAFAGAGLVDDPRRPAPRDAGREPAPIVGHDAHTAGAPVRAVAAPPAVDPDAPTAIGPLPPVNGARADPADPTVIEDPSRSDEFAAELSIWVARLSMHGR